MAQHGSNNSSDNEGSGGVDSGSYGMKSAPEKKAGEAKMSCVHTQPFLTFRGVGSWVANFFGITPPFCNPRAGSPNKLAPPSPRLCLWLSSRAGGGLAGVGSCSCILRLCNLRR